MTQSIQIGDYAFVQTEHDLQSACILDESDYFALAQHILAGEPCTVEEEETKINAFFSQFAPLAEGSSVSQLAYFTHLMCR